MLRWALIFFTILLSACQRPVEEPLPSVQKSHELVIVTHNGPVTYYVNGRNEFAGPEYDLAKMFARYLSDELGTEVHLRVVVVDNITQIIPALLKGKAHLAAANLSITHLRQHLVRFGPPYQTVQQQVIYNKSQGPAPQKMLDLIGKRLTIPAGTSYAERLRPLAETMPTLNWLEEKHVNSEELLEQIESGSLDYTICDSHLVALAQNYLPDIAPAFNFGPEDKLAWAFPKTGDEWLYQQAQAFFDHIQKDGSLKSLLDRYYGHSKRLNALDTTTFMLRMRTVLPKYIPLFKKAQELTGIDWRLLAAISYQESHWDNYATSPTNVRGLMMLTESTADRLGITDRLDPNQSIIAGARYVIMLKETIPERIPEPDRTWMALAAYNIGYAHLEDARVLAQRMKLNPDAWFDIKQTLPLLSRDEYFSTVKYGYARGGAPVVYVESIRTYYKILQKREERHVPVLPEFNLAWHRQLLSSLNLL